MRARTRMHALLATSLAISALLPPAAGTATTQSQNVPHSSQTVRHDITFIAMLVPHHQDAVEMASVARNTATTSQVRRLAAHIVEEQSREIRQMEAFLQKYDAEPMPPPAAVQEMSRQDLEMLREAEGREVDEMFLMMMRPHHAQGVAEDELKHGRNKFALNLAKTVAEDQAREIALMNDLLARLS